MSSLFRLAVFLSLIEIHAINMCMNTVTESVIEGASSRTRVLCGMETNFITWRHVLSNDVIVQTSTNQGRRSGRENVLELRGPSPPLSTSKKHEKDGGHIDFKFLDHLGQFGNINLFCGYPSFGLLVTSVLACKARVDPFACVLSHLCAMNSSDSPVVQHLLPSLLNTRLWTLWWLYWTQIMVKTPARFFWSSLDFRKQTLMPYENKSGTWWIWGSRHWNCKIKVSSSHEF